jgi:hypothetical protein
LQPGGDLAALQFADKTVILERKFNSLHIWGHLKIPSDVPLIG